MSQSARIALDATVVRPPLSGVHYAVRDQVLALLAGPQSHAWLALATDPAIVAAATTAGQPAPALSASLRRVSVRVAWQQSRLPGLLADAQCGALAALAYTAPLRCSVPTVLQVHDLIALRRPELCSRLNALHMRALMPASIRRATRILATSQTVADDILALFPDCRERLHVARLAVADRFLSPPAAPLPEAVAGLERYLLFVGVLEPKKGVDTLLDAYAQVADRTPDVTLVLAGRVGWRCAELVARLEGWRGPGRVLRLGYVEEATLPALYARAAAVVMPSRDEGFGLPVLEAMACGAPVVHSDQRALLETAGGAGVPVPVGDAPALAAALTRLLASPDLQADRAAAGRAHARARTYHDWATDFRTVVDGL